MRFTLYMLLVFSSATSASNKVDWSGFGTLTAVVSDSKNYGYRASIYNDDGVFDSEVDFKSLSMLGLQASYHYSDKVDFVGQVIARDLIDADIDEYITQAFIGYSPNVNWDIRLGRMPLDLYALSEYRNVGFAYPWANVPSEIYGIVPFQHFDGIDIETTAKQWQGTNQLKFFAGHSSSKVSSMGLENKAISDAIDIHDIFGVSYRYYHGSWNLQFRFTNAQLHGTPVNTLLLNQQIAALPDTIWPNKTTTYKLLEFNDKRANYLSFGGQQQWQQFQAQFELTKVLASVAIIPDILSGYVNIEYNGNAYNLFSYVAFTESDNYQFDINGVDQTLVPELVYGLESALNYYASNQTTFAVGWRWDISPTYSLKVQLNHSQIDKNGSTLWLNRSQNNPSESVNTVIFSMSFTL